MGEFSKTELVWNPLLNFITRSLACGLNTEVLVNRAVEFFSRESILDAKKVLWTLYENLGYNDRMRTANKDSENVLDLVKAVYRCSKDKKVLPRFVIYEPDEVPESADAVGACITTKVNQMCRKLDSVTEHLKQAPMLRPTGVTTKQHSTPLP